MVTGRARGRAHNRGRGTSGGGGGGGGLDSARKTRPDGRDKRAPEREAAAAGDSGTRHARQPLMGNGSSGGGRETDDRSATTGPEETAMDELARDVERLKTAMDEKDREIDRLARTVDDIRVSRTR